MHGYGGGDQINKGFKIKNDAEKQIIQTKADLKMRKLDLKDAMMQDTPDMDGTNQ
jgi:hypothetical protein